MRRYFPSIRVTGYIGLASFGLMLLGCGGSTTIRQQQQPTSDHPAIPPITADRLQECVKDYGNQLEGGSWAFSPTLQVNQDGYVVDVKAGEIPNTAPDFAACTRSAIGDMAIPSWIFRMRPTESATSTNEPTRAQRSLMGNPAVVVIVVVEVVYTEIVIEAGIGTILFATTVQLVDDVAEAAKKWRPKPTLNRCLDAAAGGTYLWEEFCRSMKAPGNCWSKTYESEQNKRGWCNEKFGS